MLIELRDVEVHIQPETILTQALQEGDISTDVIIRECISEDGAQAVLNSIDNEEISSYCNNYNITLQVDTLEGIFRALPQLTKTDKAKLFWQLLQCKED